jgi:two-component system LytT family response regulator
MLKIKTLIVDDESPARELIGRFLSEYDDFIIIGEAENGFEAIKLINDLKPELIFLDVQMPKISGLEMLELLDEPLPAIIFSTAWDNYAVQAFEKNAVDYLLKPYNKERFNNAIQKFLVEYNRKLNVLTGEKIKELMSGEVKILEKILVRQGSKIMVIPVEQIVYISAEDDYVSIHTLTHKYLKQGTMNFFEESLPGVKFIRIHRSFLINADFLIQLELYDRSTYMAVMKNNEKLPVSRTGSVRLKELLGE